MAAQTVTFFTGTSKTLDQSLLTKLFKGQSRLSILPFAKQKQQSGDYEGGIVWADLSFQNADEMFTLKDSFTTSKADDTEEKIQIDQKNGATIDTQITERGEWNIEGNIPVITKAWGDVFYSAGSAVAGTNPVVGQTGVSYAGQAYFMESNEVEIVMLVENANVDRSIALARIKAHLTPVFESGSPAYYKFKGTILANTDKAGTQGDWAILEKYTVA